MAKDTLTLTLHGQVPLSTFARAMAELSTLVENLTQEVSSFEAAVEWQVSALTGGSATAAITGIHHDDIGDVMAVVEAYAIIARAMQAGQPIPYSEDVSRAATALTALVGSGVTSVSFITDEYRTTFDTPVPFQPGERRYSIGVISGLVRTITDRPRLRLALYDAVFKHRVFCYLPSGQEALARAVWLQQVAVTGMIYRDPHTGRPIEVRDVRAVDTITQQPPGSYRQARGVLPWREGDEPSEVLIRRVRDAG